MIKGNVTYSINAARDCTAPEGSHETHPKEQDRQAGDSPPPFHKGWVDSEYVSVEEQEGQLHRIDDDPEEADHGKERLGVRVECFRVALGIAPYGDEDIDIDRPDRCPSDEHDGGEAMSKVIPLKALLDPDADEISAGRK